MNDVGEAIAFAESLGLAPVVEVDGSRSIANPIRLASDPAVYGSRPPRLGEHAGADWLGASVSPASVSPASVPASAPESPLASSTEGTA